MAGRAGPREHNLSTPKLRELIDKWTIKVRVLTLYSRPDEAEKWQEAIDIAQKILAQQMTRTAPPRSEEHLRRMNEGKRAYYRAAREARERAGGGIVKACPKPLSSSRRARWMRAWRAQKAAQKIAAPT